MNDDDFAELFKKLPSKPSSGTSWQDVAAEFEALGKTFGDALRGAWQRQDTDARLGGLGELLGSMIQDVNRAIDGTPEAQQARDQLVRLTESIREAAARAGNEVRPELLSLLRQANAELRRLTRLDE
jgi:ABC-type glycerol-3-phosphate transport system substrate-binding protein